MKTLVHNLPLLSALLCAASLHAQTTAFTYQGELHDNGQPAAGSYDLRCKIYDSAAGGSLVAGPVTLAATAVTDGLFTVTLDFGATVFTGADRWLEVAVRPAGSSDPFVTLSPRQPLTPTPYAIHAREAAALHSGVDATFTGTATFNPASGPPFQVGSATRVPNLNADLLDGLNSTDLVRRSGDTMTGSLTLVPPATLGFGSSVRQMLNLFGTQYGFGVQTDTLYARTHRYFAWFQGGRPVSTALDPGTGGTLLMKLDGNGRLDVTSDNSSVALNAMDVLGFFSFPRAIKATSDSIFSTAVLGLSQDGTAIAGTSANGWAGSFSGAVKVDFASPFDKPQLSLHDPSDNGFVRLRMQTGNRPFWDIAMGDDNSMRFFADGNGDVMQVNTNGQLFVNVLTIRGGADIAEPFKMTESTLSEGSVVVIDEEHPGHLKQSTRAYDTRVAGVISGAGGVKPGLSLRQSGVMEGDRPVALTGRVYVQADASNGPIKPGDLLTTSDTPGHAMKVTDHARAQGAILGKAMTRLDEGEGLVLTLVTLQ